MTIHVTLTATNERGDVLTLSADLPWAQGDTGTATQMINVLVAMASDFHKLT